jgi:hypothetical protein
MPYIAEIQDTLVSDTWKSAFRYDDVVRAPIPVLVSVTVGVRLAVGEEVVIADIQSAIATRINQTGFSNQLSSSVIADAAHNLIPSTASLKMPLDMVGELIHPKDGESVIFRSE